MPKALAGGMHRIFAPATTLWLHVLPGYLVESQKISLAVARLPAIRDLSLVMTPKISTAPSPVTTDRDAIGRSTLASERIFQICWH